MTPLSKTDEHHILVIPRRGTLKCVRFHKTIPCENNIPHSYCGVILACKQNSWNKVWY